MGCRFKLHAQHQSIKSERRGWGIRTGRHGAAGGRRRCGKRSDALDKIGNEILARREALGTLLSREEGKPRAEGIGEAARAGYIFKFFAAECLRLTGETLPSVRPHIGVEITREPMGVIGLITPWNFPIAIRLEDRTCARLRQLRRHQARRPRTRLLLGAGRHHLAQRHSGGRVQPRHGAWLGRGRRTDQPQIGERDQLHRLDRRRQSNSCRRCKTAQENPARNGWQEPAGCAR